MIRVSRTSSGFRLYVAGRRTHHGLIGSALAALGSALAIHDRRDWRRWLSDFLVTTSKERKNDDD